MTINVKALAEQKFKDAPPAFIVGVVTLTEALIEELKSEEVAIVTEAQVKEILTSFFAAYTGMFNKIENGE